MANRPHLSAGLGAVASDARVGRDSDLRIGRRGHGGTDWYVGHASDVDVSVGPAADLAFGTTPSVRVDADGADRNVLKGALAGAIAGAAAAFAMTQFTTMWTRIAEGEPSRSSGGEHDARDWQERSEDQNATELVADAIAEGTVHRRLTRDEMMVAAPLVHYGFGISMGAIYGAAAEAFAANAATGAAWGTAVWIGADNIGVPLLELSEGPQRYTPETYAQGLAAHVVYGVTTELVRRLVRAAI